MSNTSNHLNESNKQLASSNKISIISDEISKLAYQYSNEYTRKPHAAIAFYTQDKFSLNEFQHKQLASIKSQQLASNSISMYTYDLENTQHFIVVLKQKEFKIEEISEGTMRLVVDEIDLSNINLLTTPMIEINSLFGLTGLASSWKKRLIIRNTQIRLPNIKLNAREIDFEGTTIYADDFTDWFEHNTCVERVNFKNTTIIGNYINTLKLFSYCNQLEYVNIENFRLLDNNGKLKELFLSETFLNNVRLKEIEGLASFLKVNNITDMHYTFIKNKMLEKIDLGDDMDYSNITSLCGAFEGCLGLKELNLGNLTTATNTSIEKLFGSLYAEKPDLINLKLKHKGKFPAIHWDNPNSRVYIEDETMVLEHNSKSAISDLYTHRCDITDNLKNEVYEILKEYLGISKKYIEDCKVETIELNPNELDRVILKQQMFQSNFTIFKGLIALYDENLDTLTIILEKEE